MLLPVAARVQLSLSSSLSFLFRFAPSFYPSTTQSVFLLCVVVCLFSSPSSIINHRPLFIFNLHFFRGVSRRICDEFKVRRCSFMLELIRHYISITSCIWDLNVDQQFKTQIDHNTTPYIHIWPLHSLQTMMESSLTTLIGDEIEGDDKWSSFVDGKDGCFYGIPSDARRVVKFNPLDKSLTEIGPGLGEGAPIQRNIIDTAESFQTASTEAR